MRSTVAFDAKVFDALEMTDIVGHERCPRLQRCGRDENVEIADQLPVLPEAVADSAPDPGGAAGNIDLPKGR